MPRDSAECAGGVHFTKLWFRNSCPRCLQPTQFECPFASETAGNVVELDGKRAQKRGDIAKQ